jgi:hypothetical protein
MIIIMPTDIDGHNMFVSEYVKDLDKLNLVKLGNGALILGLSQFSILPQLPHRTMI